MRRRRFLGSAAALTAAWGCGPHRLPSRRASLTLEPPRAGEAHVAPLATIVAHASQRGRLVVFDGEARRYVASPVDRSLAFAVGGSLGTHLALLLDDDGRVLAHAGFRVDASSHLRDGSGRLARLWQLARWTLHADADLLARHVRIAGRTYRFLVYWLRDHVLTLHGAKYFTGETRSGIDLYADLQREDGLIWDNVEPRPGGATTWWQHRFGSFARPLEDGRHEAKRIPVTNDVEGMFVLGLHATWQATGDDAWMAGHLDRAIRALAYVLHDPLRYSSELGVLVRGFTIDGWDFLCDDDARTTGDAMVIGPSSELGAFFGDNHVFALAAERLAEMLAQADRAAEARPWRDHAERIRDTIDALAWTGTHYRHHVPVHRDVVRDLGVDPEAQLTMSNALALGRGIADDRADAIITSYRRLHEARPDVPEWISIHPAFPRGFTEHAPPGEYVNGGTLPWIAGELARGLLERGHAAEGLDVLRRLQLQLGDDDVIHGVYVGARPATPAITSHPIDLAAPPGAYPPPEATSGGRRFAEIVADAGGWRAHGVSFAPARTPGAALVVSTQPDDRASIRLAMPERVAAIVLLHEADGAIAGSIDFHHRDRTTTTIAIDRTLYGNWWAEPAGVGASQRPGARLVFRSDDDRNFVSVWAAIVPNPAPDRPLSAITLRASPDGRRWRIAAITATEALPVFDPGRISYGVPVGWGAGAVIRCLIEGVAGIVDVDRGMREVVLTPRWCAGDEDEADVLARYGDGDGYVAYRFRRDGGRIELTWTASSQGLVVRLLLPDGATVLGVTVDGAQVPVTAAEDAAVRIEGGERGRHLRLRSAAPGVHALVVQLAP